MTEITEFRVDGYTLIDRVELDYDPETESGTAYIPRSPMGTELLTSFDDFWQLVDFCLMLLGKSRHELNDYVAFMRRNLSNVWAFRVPFC